MPSRCTELLLNSSCFLPLQSRWCFPARFKRNRRQVQYYPVTPGCNMLHTTKPLLHMLRVVTLIQGNFSTQILASKMSFGFAEITDLNYVLFSRRKKLQTWAVSQCFISLQILYRLYSYCIAEVLKFIFLIQKPWCSPNSPWKAKALKKKKKAEMIEVFPKRAMLYFRRELQTHALHFSPKYKCCVTDYIAQRSCGSSIPGSIQG